MILEQARKMAMKDFKNHKVAINIVCNKLAETPQTDDGQDNRYEFCPADSMDIMFPISRKQFWEIVEVVK